MRAGFLLLALTARAAPQEGLITLEPVRRPAMRRRAETGFKINAAVTPTVNKVIPIVVGGAALTFTPNNVQANPGDILQFQFSTRNHTVTQSTEAAPCQPMPGGLHSGFIPFNAANNASGTVGTFNVPVLNTQPMFLYCAQAQHCQEGMVMTVNANSTAQLIAYANLATTMKANLPGAAVAGGSAATIPLANAAFSAAQTAPPPAAPAAPAPAAPAAPKTSSPGAATNTTGTAPNTQAPAVPAAGSNTTGAAAAAGIPNRDGQFGGILGVIPLSSAGKFA